MLRLLFLLLSFLIVSQSQAQLLVGKNTFSRADTLRGMLSPLRSCYDVNYYHLDLKVDIDKKHISGSNLIRFTAQADFKRLQIDLFANLQIDSIIFRNKELRYTREFNAVFVDFPEVISKNSVEEFKVFYSGSPVVAKNPPWDGGFVYAKDSSGKPWVAVACQGLGASSWWPNKDHQSDEPDSMMISISVPPGLMDVSNGTLRSIRKRDDGYTTYNWFVSNPINNYCATLNIGDYAHFNDVYVGKAGKLPLDFYVLKENLSRAKSHFGADVKPMLTSFEYWFGPYPFYNDGYKLVETPYLGLENQSAIAYGNKYKKGYSGNDWSGTGLGLTWDYLIVHESGHEWFGNNITSKDIADMWIHESFTTYSEGLFVESQSGKAAGARYIRGLRKHIRNDSPIIGTYNVNKEGSGDMYFKGANVLHTVRSVINDDKKWLSILRGLNKTFGLKTTTTEQVVNYISETAGIDLRPVFEQYLRHTQIPTLEIRKKGSSTQYRWVANVSGFKMPINVQLSDSKTWTTIQGTTDWKTLKSPSIKVDTDNYYIKTKIVPK